MFRSTFCSIYEQIAKHLMLMLPSPPTTTHSNTITKMPVVLLSTSFNLDVLNLLEKNHDSIDGYAIDSIKNVTG